MPPGWEYELQYIDIYVYINLFSWDKSLIERKECYHGYYPHPAIIIKQGKSILNNKAINYGNEKAISISKIVIWKFGLIKTLTLYAKIKSSYTPPPIIRKNLSYHISF